MMKTTQQATRNYARGSLMAFLDDKKNLMWLLGVIRSSGVTGPRLQEVFTALKGYGNPMRYQEAHSACRAQGWLE